MSQSDQCLLCHRPLATLRLGVLCSRCKLDVDQEINRMAALPPKDRTALAVSFYTAGLLLLAKVCEHE